MRANPSATTERYISDLEGARPMAVRGRTILVAVVAAALASLILAGAARADSFTSVSAGLGHSCATRPGGAVACWGKDYVTKTRSNVPAVVAGVVGATEVAAGFKYNCARLSSGAVACWGDDGYGQLGDGRTRDSRTPVAVVGISDATAISAGTFDACALLAGGSVACWGRNIRGVLGNGSKANSSTPVAVSGITNATWISTGFHESCAVLRTGRVACWGLNAHGQLGDATVTDSSTPVGVTGIVNAVRVSAGGGHACAVLASGKLECWGNNAFGELGVGGPIKESRTPVEVSGLSGSVVDVSVTLHYTCAALSSGAVECWGSNVNGTLGNGRRSKGSRVPVQASGVNNAVAVSTSNFHACAMLSSGAADCWGSNDYGDLGVGSPRKFFATPQQVL